MLDFLQNLILTSPLEFYTAVVATAGVVFWFIDRQSMKAALGSARSSTAIALQLERQKSEAAVERSFLELQVKCQDSRQAWRDRELQQGIRFSSDVPFSQEKKEIQRLEQMGRMFLSRFQSSAPKEENSDFKELQAYLASADRASQQIARLGAQIPVPRSHFS